MGFFVSGRRALLIAAIAARSDRFARLGSCTDRRAKLGCSLHRPPNPLSRSDLCARLTDIAHYTHANFSAGPCAPPSLTSSFAVCCCAEKAGNLAMHVAMHKNTKPPPMLPCPLAACHLPLAHPRHAHLPLAHAPRPTRAMPHGHAHVHAHAHVHTHHTHTTHAHVRAHTHHIFEPKPLFAFNSSDGRKS